MNQNTKEGMGFLCRWTLLTLTGATMIAVALSCLKGAAETTETDWDLIIPDALWRESRTEQARLDGYCSRKLSFQSPPLGITVWSTDDYKFTDNWFIFMTFRSQPGKKIAEIRGVPYGPFAFQKRTGNMYIVPLDEKVFLVDLRLAVRTRHRLDADFEECLARLDRQGTVALVLCEKVENYRSAVQSAAELHFNMPVLCVDDPNGNFKPLRTVQRTRNMLRRNKKDTSCPVFITDDVVLAVLADGDRIPTYFVGKYVLSQSDKEELHVPPGWKPKTTRQFESFAELKESLATGPAGD